MSLRIILNKKESYMATAENLKTLPVSDDTKELLIEHFDLVHTRIQKYSKMIHDILNYEDDTTLPYKLKAAGTMHQAVYDKLVAEEALKFRLLDSKRKVEEEYTKEHGKLKNVSRFEMKEDIGQLESMKKIDKMLSDQELIIRYLSSSIDIIKSQQFQMKQYLDYLKLGQ